MSTNRRWLPAISIACSLLWSTTLAALYPPGAAAAGGVHASIGTSLVHPEVRSAAKHRSFPSAKTTGSRGKLTRVHGPVTISKPGTTIRNTSFDARVTITADDVTLKNVRIRADDYWVLINYGRRLTIENSTLIGTANSQALIGDMDQASFTGRRLDLSGAGDGVKMGGRSKLYDSYIHGLASFAGAHNDGIEVNGSGSVKIIRNTILNRHGQTSAIMIEPGATSQGRIEISRNLLAGGGYTIYGGAPARNIVVRNNAFSTRYFAQGGYWGPSAYWNPDHNIWSGNVWADGVRRGQRVEG